jgi:hypothetical protein
LTINLEICYVRSEEIWNRTSPTPDHAPNDCSNNKPPEREEDDKKIERATIEKGRLLEINYAHGYAINVAK